MKAQAVWLAYDLTGEFGWIYDQALYSALSFLAAHGGAQRAPLSATIHTDDPSRFALLEGAAELAPLPRERILDWMGPRRYMHRAKSRLMAEAASRASGPMVFFDLDVWFRGRMDDYAAALAPGRALVHARERDLGLSRAAQDRELARIAGGDPDWPKGSLPMVNIGVVGLHPSDFDLLGQALDMIDRFVELPGALGAAQGHIWEQIAHSIAIARRAEAIPVEGAVCHYWAQREAYAQAIGEALGEIRAGGMGLADALERVATRPLGVPEYRPPSALERAYRKLTGKSRMTSRRIQDKIFRLK